MEREEQFRRAVERLDLDAVTREFHEQDELIFLEGFLPRDVIDEMVDEARLLRERVHRTWLPRVRVAGTVDQLAIARHAPALAALHRSPSLLALASRLAVKRLAFKHPGDKHAAALYYYQKPGDFVGWHYDHCGCESGQSYTLTLGVINDTASQVHFRLHTRTRRQQERDLFVRMTPGSLVLFCGSNAYHRVTPLARGEQRAVFSFAYVQEGRQLRGMKRFVENIKDAVLYFGPKALFQKNYD